MGMPGGDDQTSDVARLPQTSEGAAALRWYLTLARRWLWVVLSVALIGGVLTYGYLSYFVRPTYEATAMLEVDTPPSSITASGSDVFQSEAYAATVARLLNTYPVADAAFRALHLSPPATPFTLMRIANATVVPNSQLIEVTVSSPDPAYAARVANALATEGELQERQRQGSQYVTALSALADQLRDAKTSLAKLRAEEANNVPGLATQITQAQNLVGRLQQRQLDLLQLQAQASNAITMPVPASVPRTPSAPRPVRSAALVAFLLLLLSSGAVVLREYLGAALRTPEDIAHALGAPVLAAIIRSPSSSARETTGLLIAGPQIEALRVVRTNLQYSNLDTPVRTILVTSAHEGEGKSTVAFNLGVSLAEMGHHVLIIDADLRRPSLHKQAERTRLFGLTNALVTDAPDGWNQFVQSTAFPRLMLLATGPLPVDPTTVLGSRRMANLIERARAEFDMVIIDSPPMLGMADAVILSTLVDGVIAVVDVDQATLQAMSHMRRALEQVKGRLVGVVLNKLGKDQPSYYEYSYSYAASDLDQERKQRTRVRPRSREAER